ncbi:hypothetical protein BD779DRAFT_1539149 [Infundibulicybe gibba]|nr:hypothetical protein BD779DRAFT_1539149 [Infundibulicybe gibba]
MHLGNGLSWLVQLSMLSVISQMIFMNLWDQTRAHGIAHQTSRTISIYSSKVLMSIASSHNNLQNTNLHMDKGDESSPYEVDTCRNELSNILNELASGMVELTLSRETASDVALDMDTVFAVAPEVLIDSDEDDEARSEVSDEDEDCSW